MMRLRVHGWRWAAAGVLLAGSVGCERQDAERLARIGRMARERVGAVSPGAPAGLGEAWAALREVRPGEGAAARVRLRLRSDQWFESADIEVREVEPGKVALRGALPGPEQKRRALDLAQTAVGVTAVVDELTIEER
ncbi:MAG TPA: BON domain-containing protein [Gemmataceae bacterium]